MSLKLKVDGKEIPVKEFVENILSGSIVGAVTTLHGTSSLEKNRNRNPKNLTINR